MEAGSRLKFASSEESHGVDSRLVVEIYVVHYQRLNLQDS
jgi:hypothetical protein